MAVAKWRERSTSTVYGNLSLRGRGRSGGGMHLPACSRQSACFHRQERRLHCGSNGS
jgi:hypothetical protein